MEAMFALVLFVSTASPKLDPATRAEVEARVEVLQQWARDPQLVGAVLEANRNLRTMEEIEELDRRWQKTTGVDDFMRSLIEHPAADRMRELRSSNPELQEACVTDRLGGNVACTNKTSDYYQGDEAKFREAFHDGRGAVHIGELTRDESMGAYSVPVAVPILQEGDAIGVLVVAVNVEKLKHPR